VLIMLIAPGYLIFYGLALLNSTKYTLREVQYLRRPRFCSGCLLFSSSMPADLLGHGLGILHHRHGVIMYAKYEKWKVHSRKISTKVFENRVRLALMSILMVNDEAEFSAPTDARSDRRQPCRSHRDAREESLRRVKKEFRVETLNNLLRNVRRQRAFVEHLDAF